MFPLVPRWTVAVWCSFSTLCTDILTEVRTMVLPVRGDEVRIDQHFDVRERGSTCILDQITITALHRDGHGVLERIHAASRTHPLREVWLLHYAPDEWQLLLFDLDDGLVADDWAPFYQLFLAEKSA